MGFFSAPYEIVADDVAPAGPRHYLTRAAFHRSAWEDVLADARFAAPDTCDELDAVEWLARESYLRVFGPVTMGELVGVLLSFEERGDSSSVRLYLRVVRKTGEPIACAALTMSSISKATGSPTSLPSAVVEYLRAQSDQRERVEAHAFAEVTSVASLDVLFPEDVRSAGALVASRWPSGPRRTTAPRRPIIARRFSGADLVMPPHGVAFTFPGESSFDRHLLRELHAHLPYLADYFHQADDVARRFFRESFLPLVDVDAPALHEQRLLRCPELAHLVVVLCGVLVAESLQEHGIRPDVLIGDGLGELSALAVAGAIDVGTALRLTAQRALSRVPNAGSAGEAAARFAAVVREVPFSTPRLRIFSASDGIFQADTDYAEVLSSRLARAPDFGASIAAARSAGCEHFIECGPGGLLTHGATILSLPSTDSASKERAKVATELTAEPAPGKRAESSPTLPSPAARVSRRSDERREDIGGCPIAVVALGCVLPGARDADSFWRNVLDGVSGVVDGGRLMADLADTVDAEERDGSAPRLWGDAGEVAYDPRLPYRDVEYCQLTRAQQLLAHALMQAMTGLPALPERARLRCILGATAEGIAEYGSATVLERVRDLVFDLDEPEPHRVAFAGGLETLLGTRRVDPASLSPHASFGAVIERFLGTEARLTLIDAACASSLYAIDLGMRELRDGDADLIIVGGVFAPGAELTPLFARMQMLSGTGCFPFDARADGTVFGEGAAVLALERLGDALAAGHRNHAVIRGAGLSSDGESAVVNVPRAAGQALALERAYSSAGVDRRSVQLVEAHAAATPAADATEFEALRQTFSDRDGGRPPVFLESVKALIGHTGPAAGAAAMIKLCRALEEHVVPPQYNFADANPRALLNSPFAVPTAAAPWPPNADGAPRRAGVSAFGFGGTNAHVVVESFAPLYHGRLRDGERAQRPRATLAVVGVGGVFPAADRSTVGDLPTDVSLPLRSAALRPPPHARLRADVAMRIDASQLVAVMAADRALRGLTRWTDHRERIGVVLGLVGKTPHAVAALERRMLARLRRIVADRREELGLDAEDAERIGRAVCDLLERSNPSSDSYTAMGLMPNIAAARVTSSFDLNGPSLVIDAGGGSIPEVLRVAERWLATGDTDVMLAGALHADARRHPLRDADRLRGRSRIASPPLPEGGCILALTTTDRAQANGWAVRARLTIGAPGDDCITLLAPSHGELPQPPALDERLVHPAGHALVGLAELALALDAAAHGNDVLLRWTEPVMRERRDDASLALPALDDRVDPPSNAAHLPAAEERSDVPR